MELLRVRGWRGAVDLGAVDLGAVDLRAEIAGGTLYHPISCASEVLSIAL